MKIELHFTNTDLVAWWGAILATIVLAWDIYKWKTSGPQIRFTARPNMKTFNVPTHDGKTWVYVNVENIGTRATTITHLAFQYYKNWFKKVINKPNSSWIIGNASVFPEYRIPYVLNPGTIWQGCALQTDELEEKSRKGYLICKLYYSQHKRPRKYRVIIKKRESIGSESVTSS